MPPPLLECSNVPNPFTIFEKLTYNDDKVNYDDFDMSKLIVKTPIPHNQYYKAVREMYSIAFHPRFILRQLVFLTSFKKRDWQFLFTYGFRAIRRVRQHIFNLTRHENNTSTKEIFVENK